MNALKELVYHVSVINNHVCVCSTILYNIIQYVCMYAQHTNRKFIWNLQNNPLIICQVENKWNVEYVIESLAVYLMVSTH